MSKFKSFLLGFILATLGIAVVAYFGFVPGLRLDVALPSFSGSSIEPAPDSADFDQGVALADEDGALRFTERFTITGSFQKLETWGVAYAGGEQNGRAFEHSFDYGAPLQHSWPFQPSRQVLNLAWKTGAKPQAILQLGDVDSGPLRGTIQDLNLPLTSDSTCQETVLAPTTFELGVDRPLLWLACNQGDTLPAIDSDLVIADPAKAFEGIGYAMVVWVKLS
ncbi:MAG: hypothetical protein LBR58_08650 [Propionibacteriaceae bacterium]|jgi:hypothetical protein|nr:hypothetical protein [Propionibacteriaceae bacterium]